MFSRRDIFIGLLLVGLMVAVFLLVKQNYSFTKKPIVVAQQSEGFDPEIKDVQPGYSDIGMNVEPKAVPQSTKTEGENDRLTSKDLLPSEAIEQNWASVVQVPKSSDQITNYLSAGEHVNITSPNSVLKNANLDLRSQPQIPKSAVSPFLNSSYQPLDQKFNRGVDLEEHADQ